MGNTISLSGQLQHIVKPLHMSNGMTSVFLEVLVLSGSILAQTNREKELVIWLAQHDQAILGIGTVGFEIDEMAWTVDDFEAEKHFMLRIICSAIEGLGWERLDYKPNQEQVASCLKTFADMISVFEQKYVQMDNYLEWSKVEENEQYPTISVGYPQCEIHGIYLFCFGCMICNS
ncbi:hypothetical protein [Paenibacillus wenxiniae]|uniref:Uncharacterized protein n=1 Tax=Paenibacillus wenxiniae TaxID=1636843 RepID=A0ABW4RGS8_9BACL